MENLGEDSRADAELAQEEMRRTQVLARFKDEPWGEGWAGARMRFTSRVEMEALGSHSEGTELIVGDLEK